MRTITASFENRDVMAAALQALAANHIHASRVSFVSDDDDERRRSPLDVGVSVGSTLGALAAGTAGVIAAVATSGTALLGVGIAAASGAAAGGMAGGLVGAVVGGEDDRPSLVVRFDVSDDEIAAAGGVLRMAGGVVEGDPASVPDEPAKDSSQAITRRIVRLPTNVTVFGVSEVGRVRTNNEDALLVADLGGAALEGERNNATLTVGDRGVLLAVSDGMGGQQGGEIASKLVLDALRANLGAARDEAVDAALSASVEEANRVVYREARALGRAGMGATLTAVLLHGLHAYIAEVGDSRAYLLRAGRLVPLTRDQSFVQSLLDEGLLTPAQAQSSSMKNVILQAMGTKPDVVVALNRLSLRRHDRFLVCSDGLSSKVTDREIRDVLHIAGSVQVACETLVALALERGGEDNVTAIVAEVSGDGCQPLTDPDRVSLDALQAFVPPASSGGATPGAGSGSGPLVLPALPARGGTSAPGPRAGAVADEWMACGATRSPRRPSRMAPGGTLRSWRGSGVMRRCSSTDPGGRALRCGSEAPVHASQRPPRASRIHACFRPIAPGRGAARAPRSVGRDSQTATLGRGARPLHSVRVTISTSDVGGISAAVAKYIAVELPVTTLRPHAPAAFFA